MKLYDTKEVNPQLEFKIEAYPPVESEQGGKISISGVQEKVGAVVENNKIRLVRPGERATHILKPAPADTNLRERHQLPVNEHLTMNIASEVYGIETAANGICYSPEGRPVYITRRFNITPGGEKLLIEDFASLAGKSKVIGGKNFKYTGCYKDIADIIKSTVASVYVDLERFFTIVLFNYIYANGDAHLKNFSLIFKDNEYRLTPAYDLINTSMHINDGDFALEGGLAPELEKSDVYERTGHPCREDFRNFGILIGIKEKRLEKILDKFCILPERVEELINSSCLTAKNKRNYLRIIGERVSRFNRGA